MQCAALVPGVSRSGATISAGLFRGLDRVTATRVSFFLSIPALLAAGLFELKDALGGSISVGETLVGTVVAFLVAYASIAWLLKFVAGHSDVPGPLLARGECLLRLRRTEAAAGASPAVEETSPATPSAISARAYR
jgi:hypothetical protein